jgi:hypothetical protein
MSQGHQQSIFLSPIAPTDLRTLRNVEAYLFWNLNGTNNLITRLQTRVADIDEKLLKEDLDAQEKKKTRKGRYKAVNKLGHCRAEAHMLQML